MIFRITNTEGVLHQEFVLQILAPLLLLMTLAFAWGFTKDIQAS